MRLLNDYRLRLVLVGIVAAVEFSVGITRADFSFGEPTNMGPTVNSSSGDVMRCMTIDGLEMYIASDRPGGLGSWDLWVSKRSNVDDNWGPPENLGAPVNSSTEEFGATISPDGLTLYFNSRRAGGYGINDIWVTTRTSREGDWSEPVNLGPPVNGPAPDAGPWISTDGLKLYFISTRGGTYTNMRDWEIWVTTRETESSAWSEPVSLGLKYSPEIPNLDPCVSADDRLLVFSDWGVGIFRPGGYGNADIWLTVRNDVDGNWGTPVNPGPLINGPYEDGPARISSDGKTLYFSSMCPGGLGGEYGDIYEAPIIPIIDFDGNGIVDADDMSIMIDHWGEDYSLCDIGPMPWGDAIVDVEDLKVLAEHLFEEVDDPTLMAHWPLDEVQGLIAYNNITDCDGTLTGDPVWQPDAGMIDGALELDGIDDYVVTDYVLDPMNGPFSVFAWIKGGGPGQVVISQQSIANWLALDTEGYLMTELKCTGRSAGYLFSETVITDGQWHRIGLVWDGSNRTLCVDGVIVAEDTQPNLESSQMGFYIGTGKAIESSTFFSGLIDDIRIYNRVVSP